MIEKPSLHRALLVGTALQIAMVVAGHFIAWIAINLFALGGMGISAAAGFLYGRGASSYAGAALGGALAGGLCALIGIAVSVALGDTAVNILAFGTVGSAVTGVIGAVLGKLISGNRTVTQS